MRSRLRRRVVLLRQSEIEDLHRTLGRHHHVGGLEIAMRDPACVRGADRIGEWHGNLQQPVERQAAARDQFRQRAAVDQLHGQEHSAVHVFNGMDGDDVRVVEGCDGASLAFEALPVLGIRGRLRREQLEGDVTLQLQVARPIHLPHAAGSDQDADLVVAEGRPG